MAFDQDQVNELKRYYPKLQDAEEGGQSFILISEMALPSGCDPQMVDGLLCPSLRDGYPSRLFFSSKIVHRGRGNNWNADGVVILGRRWWAVSWHTHKNNQRLLEMVTTHLQAFK